MNDVWLFVIATSEGHQVLAMTADPRACDAIRVALETVYQIAGACLHMVQGKAL